MQWTFLDLDSEIEKSEQMPVRDIFRKYGEVYFRRIESEHIRKVASMPHAVIALGGGAFVDPENRTLLDATGMTVWLQASLDSINERVRPDGSRPLFLNMEDARRLYEARAPSYRLAQLHIVTDNRLPDAIAEDIARQVASL
jgi:shikimate kinase